MGSNERTAAAITAAGNLVHNAATPPGQISQNLELQLTVSVADLVAALTPDELQTIAGTGGPAQSGRPLGQGVIFAVGLTDASGNLLGNTGAYAEATCLSRVALTREQIVALRQAAGGH